MTTRVESLAKSEFDAVTAAKIKELLLGFASKRADQFMNFYAQFWQFGPFGLATESLSGRTDALVRREKLFCIRPDPAEAKRLDQDWDMLHESFVEGLYSLGQGLKWDGVEKQLDGIASMASVHRSVWGSQRETLKRSMAKCQELLGVPTDRADAALRDAPTDEKTAVALRDDALKMIRGTIDTILGESGLDKALADD